MEFKTKYGDFLVYENDMEIVSSFRIGKVYEEDFILQSLAKFIEKSKYVLDIGAHVGSHCITYCKINPNLEIMAFEPQTKVFELLNRNIINNHLTKNIHAYNVCVGHKNMRAMLSINATDSPNPNNQVTYGGDIKENLGGVGLGVGGEECSMISIDSLNLEGCDFMKVDVEGFEPLVFLGGINTIDKFKPVICFEKNNKDISKEMYNKLDISLPYRYLTTYEILISLGYLIIYESNCNFIAIHRSKTSISYNF